MKYFTIKELAATSRASYNVPNLEEEANLRDLVEYILDPLREAWGSPIQVNSGFRNAAVNKAVGGVASSQHTKGQAADITTGTKDGNRKLFELIQRLNLPFDQLIDEKDFAWVHVSYDAARSRKQVLQIK